MRISFAALIFSLCITAAVSPPSPHENDAKSQEEEAAIRSLIEQNFKRYEEIIPSIHLEEPSFSEYNNVTIVGFSWSNCGSPSDAIQVSTMEMSPDPITIPGNIVITLDAVVKATVETATSLAVVMKKKLFGVFVEIPCVDNVGSCTYEQPCELLKNITCPPELKEHGFSCQCPFAAKEYNLDKVNIKVPSIKIPESLANGDYQIQATLMNGSTRIMCYQVDVSLHVS